MSETRDDKTDAATLFGEWLSQQRKARDLTQEDLAERIGCSVWSIQKIEVGTRRPSKQVAQILADYFDISPAERPRSFSLLEDWPTSGSTPPRPRACGPNPR